MVGFGADRRVRLGPGSGSVAGQVRWQVNAQKMADVKR